MASPAAAAAAGSEQELSTQEILGTYQSMTQDCRNIASKIQELNLEKDEHRLVVDSMSKLEGERRAFRLIGGALVAQTVGEVLPKVSANLDGITQLLERLDENLKQKDAERKAFKDKYGIMTQEEKENMIKRQAREAQQQAQGQQKLVGAAKSR